MRLLPLKPQPAMMTLITLIARWKTFQTNRRVGAEHPKRIVDWLREQGGEEIAYAVSFHQTAWGLPPKTPMDKALLACDELAGFVVACCLVCPDGIISLKPKSVKKKLKDKGFAAKVDREIILDGVELLGVDLGEHIQFVIDALKPHAEELGIEGNG